MKTTWTWKAGLKVPLVLILSAEVTKVTETDQDCQDGEIIEGTAREFEASNKNAEAISNEQSVPDLIADQKAVK